MGIENIPPTYVKENGYLAYLGGIFLEEKMKELLSQYPFEVKHLYRGRGAWMIETDHGLKIMRPYEGSPERLKWEWTVKNELKERGCKYIDHIVSKIDESLFVTDEDRVKYVVTEWFSGRECNMRDRQEVLHAVVHLAGLHRKMQCFSENIMWESVQEHENILEEMQRRIRELRTIRNYAAHKKQKNDFDRKYLEVYSRYNEDGNRAMDILRDMDYSTIYEQCCKEKYLCHGDYNQHNLILYKDRMALVRFDHMHCEMQAYDLYVFMRKVLEKNRWNTGFGMAMLDAYMQVLPLDYRQMRCFYGFMLYPEKFWKIVNRYQNTRKSWMSAQNMAKLDKVIQEQEARDYFIQTLDDYCEKIE